MGMHSLRMVSADGVPSSCCLMKAIYPGMRLVPQRVGNCLQESDLE